MPFCITCGMKQSIPIVVSYVKILACVHCTHGGYMDSKASGREMTFGPLFKHGDIFKPRYMNSLNSSVYYHHQHWAGNRERVSLNQKRCSIPYTSEAQGPDVSKLPHLLLMCGTAASGPPPFSQAGASSGMVSKWNMIIMHIPMLY